MTISARLALAALGATLAVAALAAALSARGVGGLDLFLLTAAAGVPVGVVATLALSRRPRRVLGALADGLRAWREKDFGLRIAPEAAAAAGPGELVTLFNATGEVLRAERNDVYQKEILLDTVLQAPPSAVLLTGPHARVVFANRAARELFAGGKPLEGRALDEVLAGAPEALRRAVADGADTLFTTDDEGDPETFHVARRVFTLTGRRHDLLLIKTLTRELARQEVTVWKNVIRTLSHELNNSLAPISSLVHSARLILDKPEQAHRLGAVFDTIEERTRHLASFLESYARFARLPRPNPEPVTLRPFVERLRTLCAFELEGEVPPLLARFNPGQLEQVLINLLKNAAEAGSDAAHIRLAVEAVPDGLRLTVMDRGRGMDEETLRRALLPFYSTKRNGTGLGLPLCREILEAHGGRLRLRAREGGGTVVTCWLPGAPVAAPAPAAETAG